jgi:DNA (cytosine-5)-methyltransferase 1
MNLYNEIDPYCCDWMQNLISKGAIPNGTVNRRSITELRPGDLVGFNQCHFFCGIAGWPIALRIAGWPEDLPCFSGSCPCQPWSCAGKKKGQKDERDLWPDFFKIIKESRPQFVFGEQVASSDVVGSKLEADFLAAIQSGNNAKANKLAERIAKKNDGQKLDELDQRWITRVCSDLEEIGYSVWFSVLGAHSVSSPHKRQRLYWVAYTGVKSSKWGTGRLFEKEDKISGTRISDGNMSFRSADGRENFSVADNRQEQRRSWRSDGIQTDQAERTSGPDELERRSENKFVAYVESDRRRKEFEDIGRNSEGNRPEGKLGRTSISGEDFILADNERTRREEARSGHGIDAGREFVEVFYDGNILIQCRDDKIRRIEPGILPVVNGIPKDMGRGEPELRRLVKGARANRKGRLRAYGNAIQIGVAVKFIRAFMDSIGIATE